MNAAFNHNPTPSELALCPNCRDPHIKADTAEEFWRQVGYCEDQDRFPAETRNGDDKLIAFRQAVGRPA